MTACGKAILNGEHFVLYGAPAIAVPLPSCRLRLVPGPVDRPPPWLPEAWRRAWEVLGEAPSDPVPVRVESDLPIGSGLGSSAALSVALVRLVARQCARDLSCSEVARAAREVEHLFHRPSSGLDPAVVAWEAPILWRPDREPEVLPWSLPDLDLVIAVASGSRSTADAVQRVRDFARDRPETFREFLDASRDLTEAWAAGLRAGRLPSDPGFWAAHRRLRAMGLSSPSIEALVTAMEAAGAVGAKISGAGLAGAVVALVPLKRLAEVERAARESGALAVLRAGLSGSRSTAVR